MHCCILDALCKIAETELYIPKNYLNKSDRNIIRHKQIYNFITNNYILHLMDYKAISIAKFPLLHDALKNRISLRNNYRDDSTLALAGYLYGFECALASLIKFRSQGVVEKKIVGTYKLLIDYLFTIIRLLKIKSTDIDRREYPILFDALVSRERTAVSKKKNKKSNVKSKVISKR